MSKLTITTDSWHWKYKLFLNKLWGLEKPKQTTSLCPYFQSIFWTTVFTIITSPLVVAGWLALKALRLLYVFANKFNIRFILYFYKCIGLDEHVSLFSHRASKSPWDALAFTGVIVLAIVALIFAFVSISCFLFMWGLMNIQEIPMLIWGACVDFFGFILYAITSVGAAIFITMGGVGSVIHWVISATELWLTILAILAYVVICFFVLFAAGFVIYKLACTSVGKKTVDILKVQKNGFETAFEKYQKTTTQAANTAVKRNRVDIAIKYVILQIKRQVNALVRAFKRIFIVDITIAGEKKTSLTIFGVVWEYAKAIKHGVCPMIEIVNPEILKICEEILAEPLGDAPQTAEDFYEKIKLTHIRTERDLSDITKDYITLFHIVLDAFCDHFDHIACRHVHEPDKEDCFKDFIVPNVYNSTFIITARNITEPNRLAVPKIIKHDVAKYILGQVSAKDLYRKYWRMTDDLIGLRIEHRNR